ncbi:MAG: hypothetical protein EHM17_07420 [Verrucomicrobiaceae bacterium]|nr:MAG: hypothetical protein EHM17_07420 [Verrucomicrobiaceae bacterium]
MATNVDKALTSANPLLGNEPFQLELDLDLDDSPSTQTQLDDGSIEITLGESTSPTDTDEDISFDANLADYLDESVLATLASDLIDEVETDIQSRKDWVETYVKGMEVLGLKYEERMEPWEDACGVYSAVLSEAAIRFQAETMQETFPAAGPVKTLILGESTPEKEKAAERVRDDMNYQITEVMSEYRTEHERALFNLALAGSVFKKVYFDPNLDRQVSITVPAEDIIVPWGATDLNTAERVTHILRKTKLEMQKLQASEFYRDVDLGEARSYHTDLEKKKAEDSGFTITDDNRYSLFECHADLVIPGFDAAEDEDNLSPLPSPYVVTLDRGSQTILSIRRNWEPHLPSPAHPTGTATQRPTPTPLKRQHFVHYPYIIGFGFYGLGLIHIIGGYARAGTSLIRQLVDAGTLNNLPGGLKARGMRIKGDDTPIAPGEFRDVDIPSGAIRDNIMPLPYKEPSQVLLALLNQITEEGRRLGAISDLNVSDMSANAPVGTTLAILERTLKPMAAVQARVHYAMKQEFKLLKALIAEYAPSQYDYKPSHANRKARREDYATTEVIPVSDPNSSTMAQRVVQYQAIMQMAQAAPQIYDLPYLHRQMIEVLGVKNADKILPMPEDQTPRDPISENMAVMIGKPVKAFIYQDHDAHISAHMTFLQDPMIAATLGQNPMAQQMQAALMAHVAEHLGYSYRKQIEEQLGVPLPPPDKPLPEEFEVQLSRLVADASKQLVQMHQSQAAQQQAQQQAQDPLLQIQQQELQVKQQDIQRKAQKDALDAKQADRRLSLEEQRLLLDAQKSGAQLQAQDKQNADRLKMDLMKTVVQQQRKPKEK